MGALTIVSALSFACDKGTRIEGKITLEDGLEAPDAERHTLYVAAFLDADVTGAVFDTGAAPAFVEFGGIANDDFDPSVTFALGGAGAAEEMHVFVWWKIGDAEHPDYELPEQGDRFGVYADNPVFEGASGDESDSEKAVDVELDRVFGVDTAGFAANCPFRAAARVTSSGRGDLRERSIDLVQTR